MPPIARRPLRHHAREQGLQGVPTLRDAPDLVDEVSHRVVAEFLDGCRQRGRRDLELGEHRQPLDGIAHICEETHTNTMS